VIGPAVVSPPPSQPVAVLTRAARAHARPDRSSGTVQRVPPRAPITGAPTALPVIARRAGAHGRSWLRVELPGRPNGRSGWIVRQGVRVDGTAWALRVRLGARTVDVYRSGRRVRRFRAVVGAAATPTPVGRFFVEENVRMPRTAAGAPFALALSARSDVLQEFAGGPGQIALHGRANVGGTLGTAASHGCVRLADASIRWLARRIVPGTMVTISAGG
jgi:lipoprotein-anchoring transpeptidase ErfK/SrfK